MSNGFPIYSNKNITFYNGVTCPTKSVLNILLLSMHCSTVFHLLHYSLWHSPCPTNVASLLLLEFVRNTPASGLSRISFLQKFCMAYVLQFYKVWGQMLPFNELFTHFLNENCNTPYYHQPLYQFSLQHIYILTYTTVYNYMKINICHGLLVLFCL